MHRVITAKPLTGYRLHLTFADGTAGEVDLSGIAFSGGIFDPLRDPQYFGRVTVNDDTWTIEWPNGADVCPDVLYKLATAHAGEPIPAK
ncbi:MAG: DUF2442 domain-containing protein [Candidatus Sumerlaeaceae bacterium]|nr:DUF2442 domain-containing protein [Candidatus Sumerlaeaceae bacterium]